MAITDTYEEEQFHAKTLEKVHHWLVQVTYWYGWTRGLAAAVDEQRQKQTRDVFYLFDYELDPKSLEFRWYRHQGRVYLTIYEAGSPFRDGPLSTITLNGRQMNQLAVFGYHVGFHPELAAATSGAIEQKIQEFFPGIRGRNSYRLCSMPSHLARGGSSSIRTDQRPILDLCEQVSKRWLCTDCIERYDLDPDHFQMPNNLNKTQQAEFARLKPALRLSILERDGFVCTACQRSPLKGDWSSLSVVHRLPVSAKGKTAPENLLTVCKECLNK